MSDVNIEHPTDLVSPMPEPAVTNTYDQHDKAHEQRADSDPPADPAPAEPAGPMPEEPPPDEPEDLPSAAQPEDQASGLTVPAALPVPLHDQHNESPAEEQVPKGGAPAQAPPVSDHQKTSFSEPRPSRPSAQPVGAA
jgi:hypothetical protein